MDHYEDRFLLIPAFPAWQTTRVLSNPSWTASAIQVFGVFVLSNIVQIAERIITNNEFKRNYQL
jgi:hypothetical protein